MSQTNWEADKMLDVYIHDYLMKRKLHATAKSFQEEGKVSADPVAIDAPGGFLFEWWSVFWDIFIARTNEKHSEAAASFIETHLIKTREQQQQHQHQQQQHKPQQPQELPQSQQAQVQQLILQRQAQQHQQQRRDGGQLLNGAANALVGGNDMLMRQNSAAASALAAKMYEERAKLPLQKDAFDDAAMKQRLGENVGQILDPNQASLLKAAALVGQPHGQVLHGTPGGISGNMQQSQNRSQQLPSVAISTQETKGEMMNSRAAVPEGSLIGIHGPNQGSSNLTLKGWPLPALDRFRPGLLSQSNPLMQSPQPFSQLQQQLLLQAQQNLASPSANDLESRRLRMLLTNRNASFGKDGQLSYSGDVSNVGSPVQVGCPVLPRADPDMLLKQQQLQNNNQQRQQYPQQHLLSSQTPQSSNHQVRQQDKVIGTGSVATDGGSMSNSFQGNDQGSKSQIGRKRKQTVSSSGPANSSGTANTAGPSPSSPSTPSTHTPGDAMSMPSLPHNGGSSKPLLMFGSDGIGPLTTAPSQLGDIDRFVDDGSLEDNVESFLSDDADPRDRVSQCADVGKGFSIKEARAFPASTNKVECCHFSPDGKLLATGGHDRKAILWCTESFTMKSTLEEHSQWITDVRFSPNASRLATSSADKTVRVWDADNPGFSIRTFTGHSSTVMSLDFHPSKEDLLCSCDNNNEIRYWDVKHGSCAGVCKGGATQLRFQPCFGRILAAAADNFVSLLDVETQICKLKLQGHKNLVNSVCWDASGEYLASVSDDLIRVWRVGSGSKAEYVHELSGNGNKFHTCVFHPTYPILVIGCYETLEIWNMAENKTFAMPAHDKLVSSLAVSKVTGLMASASHDKFVKLWQ